MTRRLRVPTPLVRSFRELQRWSPAHLTARMLGVAALLACAYWLAAGDAVPVPLVLAGLAALLAGALPDSPAAAGSIGLLVLTRLSVPAPDSTGDWATVTGQAVLLVVAHLALTAAAGWPLSIAPDRAVLAAWLRRLAVTAIACVLVAVGAAAAVRLGAEGTLGDPVTVAAPDAPVTLPRVLTWVVLAAPAAAAVAVAAVRLRRRPG